MSKRALAILTISIVLVAALSGALFASYMTIGPGAPLPPPTGFKPALAYSGTLIDAVETPVASAKIKLDTYTTESDSKGGFRLPELSDGKYVLEVSTAKPGSGGEVQAHYRFSVTRGELLDDTGKPAKSLLVSLPYFAKDYRGVPPTRSKDVILDKASGFQIVKDIVVITWKAGTTKNQRDAVLARLPGAKVRGELSEAGLTSIKVTPGKLEAALRLLNDRSEVTSATKDFLLSPQYQPKDADWPDRNKSWSLRKVEAEQSWEVSAGSRDKIIAVIDEGFQLDHPELKDVFVSDLATDYTTDGIGTKPDHGTHVSGIIAMQPDDEGLVGIAPRVRIMPIRVQTFEEMAFAIQLASKTRGVWAINMSMGVGWAKANANLAAEGKAPYTIEQMQEFITKQDPKLIAIAESALRRDVLLVHAAGNDAMDKKFEILNTPAVLTVANMTKSDGLAASSNRGNLVDVGAPGTGIWSAVGGSTYNFMSGTSMASPLAAGTVMAVRAANPALSAKRVRELIIKAAESTNAGPRINAWQAVLAATRQYGVKGKVVDQATRLPIAGATVVPYGMAKLAVKTEADGTFAIAAIPRDSEPASQRWKFTVRSQGKRKNFTLASLSEDKWVHRDVVFRMRGKTDKITQLGFNSDLQVSCAYQNPYYGLVSTPETVYVHFAGPVSAPLGAFTGTWGELSRENQQAVYLRNIRFSGNIASLSLGGKVRVEVDGVFHKEIPGIGFNMDSPIHLQIDGEVAKEGDTTYTSGPASLLKVTSLKMSPFKTFAYRNEDKKQNVVGRCTYKFDPLQNGLATNPEHGDFMIFTEDIADK